MISKIISLIASFFISVKSYAKIIFIFLGLFISLSIIVYSNGYSKGKNDCEQKIKDDIINNQEAQDNAVNNLPKSQKERLQWIRQLKVRL